MRFTAVRKHISDAIVSDRGYSRGFVCGNYAHIEEILSAFPETHLDLICNSINNAYGLELQRKYSDRVKVLQGKREKYPTFATSEGSVFYDYAIIGRGYRQLAVWSQVYIGGVMMKPSTDEVLYKRRWIVIMGCNRGGTKYIAEVFKTLDIGVRHQGYGEDGIVGGGCAALMPPPGSVVLHQVRHPLRIIEAVASLRTMKDGRQRPLAIELSKFPAPYIGHTYEEGIGDPILWGMRYWYYWNRLSERKALWTYRVEELPRVWGRFCFYTGIEKPMPRIPTDTNTRRHKVKYPSLRWKDLAHRDLQLTEKIRAMARRYGYDA